MFNKKITKLIAIIFLIIANIAIIIALVVSIRNAIGKIEAGKNIAKEDVQEENKEIINEEISDDKELEETKKFDLKQIIGQLNSKNTSPVEIILVLVGISLFVIGLILIKIVKKIA